jgi:MOSC domain-containing protein YiiM
VRALRRAAERALPLPRKLTVQEGVQAAAERSGLNCRIIVGGIIRTHDRIEWCDPGSLDVSVRAANEAIPLERPPDA